MVIKPKRDQPKQDDGQGEFADVSEKKQGGFGEKRGGRGGRGGRGRGDGEDGERRGGGERRGRGDGENRGEGRGRGERRGRGDGERRGGRGRGDAGNRVRNQATDEDGNPMATDGAEAGGYREGYKGKAREGDHPFDRKSGTGRGKRDDRRTGGRDGWGADKDKKPETEDGAEEAKIVAGGDGEVDRPRNNRDRQRERREPEVKEESEEEVGFTLDDYEAQKKASTITAKGREHEKVNQKGLLANDVEKNRAAATIATKITGSDVHAKGRGEGAELLGFSGRDDDFGFEARQRGPKRGGERGGRGGARGGARGGRKGGKPIFDARNEDDFPAL